MRLSWLPGAKDPGPFPKVLWLFELAVMLGLMIYALAVAGGRPQWIFYSWLAACLCGAAAMAACFWRRRLIVGSVNLAVLVLTGLHLFTIPF